MTVTLAHTPAHLDLLDAPQLRELVLTMSQQMQQMQQLIDRLTHEMAVLKRLKFALQSERHSRSPEEQRELEESIDADLQALEQELQRLQPQKELTTAEAVGPRRTALPAELPRHEIYHEPEPTQCRCGCEMKRIGEDVSERLDYQPGVFSVQRHIRGKWVCRACETIQQAPIPAHIIDKGLASTALLAQVLVAKYADHVPLHRQQSIFARSGVELARSTLAQWVGSCGVQLQPLVDALKQELLQTALLHADETPVQMLNPGQGKTQRAYLWAYSSNVLGELRAVVYDFCHSRAGQHSRNFLQGWSGALVCDDYVGYKQIFTGSKVIELGCMAHARRKFFDLHAANKSHIAGFALEQIGKLYDIERQAQGLNDEQRLALRQQYSRPILEALQQWMQHQRQQIPDSSATAKALDYSLRRWAALTRFADNGHWPIDNNWAENQMRPIALGRKNWLFAGSLRAGQRAAAIMSLIQSARLNGHDPYVYLRDVMTLLPTTKQADIASLLPHHWQPSEPATSP